MTPIRHLMVTGSTNADARQAFMAEGARTPLWIIADRQTEGTGRRGRTWYHGSGNFAGTLLWPIASDDLKSPALFSFITGLAVADASIEAGAPADALRLKWPNDVLLRRRKLAGILCELVTEGEDRAVAIGIGVNLVSRPEGTDHDEATALCAVTGHFPTPRDFCHALDEAFRRYWAAYKAEGFAPVRSAWLEKAGGLDETLTVRCQSSTQIGIFRGIDNDGALLLEVAGTTERVTAGDVFLGPGSV